jgi:uncharacterized Tic20 family protein
VRDENYGMQREWEPRSVATPRPVSAADERSWSALVHLSAFLNLFTGFLGPVAALVVWLVYRERSSVVANNAMRSVVYQTIWLAGLFLGWTVTFILTMFVVGVLLWPVMLGLSLAFFVHASYEAYRAYRDGAVRHYL